MKNINFIYYAFIIQSDNNELDEQWSGGGLNCFINKDILINDNFSFHDSKHSKELESDYGTTMFRVVKRVFILTQNDENLSDEEFDGQYDLYIIPIK